MKTLLLSMMVMIASVNVFASEGMDWSATPNQTKLEVLSALYESSAQPADLSDFTKGLPLRKCVFAPKSSPNILYNIGVRVVSKLVSAAQPANGPLFPAQNEVRQDILILGGNVKASTVEADFIQKFSNQTTSTDLQVITLEGTFAAETSGAVKVSFRKNGSMVPFKIEAIYKESSSNPLLLGMGYCY